MKAADKSGKATAGTLRSSRWLAIEVVSLLPAAILAWLLVAPLNREIDDARREQRSFEYLAAVKNFTRAALDHRRSAADFVAGSGSTDSVQVTRKAEAVETALTDLDTVDRRLGNDDTHKAVADLRRLWDDFRAGLAGWAKVGDFERFWERATGLLRAARELAAMAASPSPEASTTAPALRMSLVRLLDDADQMSQAALLTRQAARARRLERLTEGRLQRVLGHLDVNGEALRRDLREGSGQVHERLQPKVRESVQSQQELHRDALRRIEANVLRDAAPVDEFTATGVVSAGQRAIEQNLELFDTLALALNDLTGQRIASRERIVTRAAVALLVGVTLSLLAAYLIARLLAPAASAGVSASRIDHLRRLAARLQEAAEAVRPPAGGGLAADVLSETMNRLARVGEAAREIHHTAQRLDEDADQTSVAALNVAIHAAVGGGAADSGGSAELEQLAEHSVAAARQIAWQAHMVEADAAALTASLEASIPDVSATDSTLPASLDRLKQLVGELRSATESLH